MGSSSLFLQQLLLNLKQLLIQRPKQMQIHTTLELMVMPDTHMAMLVMPPTQLIILERDLPMLNQKLNQKLILTTMELMLMDMDILMPTTHTRLTTLERDLLMLRLSQKLIHTILPTMDMLDMVVDITVIHMGLTTLESKSKTEKRSKD